MKVYQLAYSRPRVMKSFHLKTGFLMPWFQPELFIIIIIAKFFCISEIARVTKSGGNIYLMLPDQRYKNRDLVLKQVEQNTYLPETGDEKGVPHVIYDDNLVKSDFKDFETIFVRHSDEDHYLLLLKKP